MVSNELIIRNTLEGIGEGNLSLHLAHILCLNGSCIIIFNGTTFHVQKGDCIIIRATQLIENLNPSEDFCVKVIYTTPIFIEKATPNTNYGMRGSLSLSQNPVMHLTEEEFNRCKADFEDIEKRLETSFHHFYDEMTLSVFRVLILDLFDFHVRIYGKTDVPSQKSSTLSRFMYMLERGDYRKEREVAYYASELCLAPKYLSEISKKISGFSALWWINRFTILDITRQLRDRSKSLTDIAIQFNFSSPANFSRYVQRYLGESPSDFRK